MRQPLSCVLDTNTKDVLKTWLENFHHCDDIYVDIDGYKIEFTTMDDRGHMQKMTIPSIYLESECCMYKIEDLLGDENGDND